MSESQLGTVLAHIHGGRIILKDNGQIVYYSSAFNPLNVRQLEDILNLLKITLDKGAS